MIFEKFKKNFEVNQSSHEKLKICFQEKSERIWCTLVSVLEATL